MSSRPLTRSAPRKFAPDARFAVAAKEFQALPGDAASESGEEDPLQVAWQSGFVEGEQQASRLLDEQLQELRARFEGLGDAFARLSEQHADALREKLREVVIALCEEAITPFALDHDALARRIEKAAAMTMRASDDCRIKINPDDLELVADLVDRSLVLEPDPNLARGALRIETAQGGIEDGPESWQRVIREALSEC